jgi:hypothetical protein
VRDVRDELLLLLFRRRERVEPRVESLGDLARLPGEVRGRDPLEWMLLGLREAVVEGRQPFGGG